MRVGAIDVGSNSIRLLVADVAESRVGPGPGELTTVARAGEACRLARGLDGSGQIAEEMSDRAVTLAAEFVRRARSLGAEHLVIGATAALRGAQNGVEIARRLSEACGETVRILTGEEEARLVYRAVISGLGQRARQSQCIVFDLGGGSTEVVSGVGDRSGRWVSLPFGAVSLTERFFGQGPPNPTELATGRDYVREVVMHECASMPERSTLLAGVGGTVTVLASLDRGMNSYEPSQIEGWQIESGRARALVNRLIEASHEERLSWPIMGEGRADIIGAGAMVVGILLERFPAPGLVCSTQGLRYGLARLAAEECLARRNPPNGT